MVKNVCHYKNISVIFQTAVLVKIKVFEVD